MRVTSRHRSPLDFHPRSGAARRSGGRWLAFAVLASLAGAPLVAAESTATADASSDETERTLEAAFQFARGKLLVDEGAFEKAQKAYARSLELDGSDPYSRIEVAKFHSYRSQISRSAQQRLDHLQSAAGFAGEARRLAPENTEILRDFAQIQMRLGEHQLGALNRALEAFEELRSKTEGDLQVLTSLGQIYLWKRQGAKAVEVLQEAARYLPEHRMIQTMLLEALRSENRGVEAEEVLNRLIGIEPTSLEHRLRLAELLADREDHRAAAAVLSAAPDSLSSNPRLRQFLAQELHLSGDNERALAMTDALRNEFPRGEFPRGSEIGRLRVAIYSALTQYQDAIEELEPLLDAEQDAERKLQGTLHLSRLLERVGRSEEAARVLRARHTEQEPMGRLQIQLAVISVLERDGRQEEAIAMLRAELEVAQKSHLPMLGRSLSDLLNRSEKPDDALAVLAQTIERLDDGEHDEAIERLELRRLALLAAGEDWEELAARAPALTEASSPEIQAVASILHAEALAGLGQVDDALELLTEDDLGRQLAKRAELLFENEREAEAKELLRAVIDRGEAEDLLFVSQVYQRLERYADSIPLLQRLVAQDDSLQALFLLGAAHERSGQRPEAVAAFQKLLELSPDYAPALNYLGYMWAELGENLAEAITLIVRALALEPDNGAYVDSLGWAYFQLGRYQEARGHLEWAARMIPDDATIFEHLGDLYVVLRDIERARDSYRQALNLGGEDIDELRRKLETLDHKDL